MCTVCVRRVKELTAQLAEHEKVSAKALKSEHKKLLASQAEAVALARCARHLLADAQVGQIESPHAATNDIVCRCTIPMSSAQAGRG